MYVLPVYVIDEKYIFIPVLIGNDDKYWGGHFGTMISNAVLRVKNEISAAKDDAYADVAMATVEERKQEVGAFMKELISQYKDELEDLKSGMNMMPSDDKESLSLALVR